LTCFAHLRKEKAHSHTYILSVNHIFHFHFNLYRNHKQPHLSPTSGVNINPDILHNQSVFSTFEHLLDQIQV
jgi:hypothetical protein